MKDCAFPDGTLFYGFPGKKQSFSSQKNADHGGFWPPKSRCDQNIY
jgi:hypothetical protein